MSHVAGQAVAAAEWIFHASRFLVGRCKEKKEYKKSYLRTYVADVKLWEKWKDLFAAFEKDERFPTEARDASREAGKQMVTAERLYGLS